jgi:predicted transcriptional regulator of viral defense system
MITIYIKNKMNEKGFRDAFEPRPLFTLKQVSALMGSGYSKVYLNRLTNKGSIIRIGRGLYTFHRDPLIYATHIVYPSYISFLYAMQLHGLTTQQPKLVEVLSRRRADHPGVELVRSKYVWGYRKVLYSGFEIFLAEKEKLAIDGIVHERLTLDDIGDVLKECDIRILNEYALKLDRADMRRVGYVCSLHGNKLDDLHEFVKNDRNYVRSVFYAGPNDWKVRP